MLLGGDHTTRQCIAPSNPPSNVGIRYAYTAPTAPAQPGRLPTYTFNAAQVGPTGATAVEFRIHDMPAHSQPVIIKLGAIFNPSTPGVAALPTIYPGGQVDYTINVSVGPNGGAANITVTDSIPTENTFITGLSAAYTGGAVTPEYSRDSGATWTYTPPAAAGTLDPNVTTIH